MGRVFLTAVLALASVRVEAAALLLRAGDCARLVAYTGAPDVAYTPGLDVDGRPLVPADIEPPTTIEPEGLAIPLEVPIARAPGLAGDQDRFVARGGAVADYDADVTIGTVRIEGGRVSLDGRPLGDGEAHALAEACRRALDANAPKPRP